MVALSLYKNKFLGLRFSRKVLDIGNLLKISVFGVFIGRSWQHIFWDAPYRSYLWDEGRINKYVEMFTGLSWFEYVTSLRFDDFIESFVIGTGYLYLACALIVLIYRKEDRFFTGILSLGAVSLFVLSLLEFKSKFFQIGQLIEHGLQIFSPIIFLWFLFRDKKPSSALYIFLLISCALTFIGHGLYAFGVYPVPGYFYSMVMKILFLNQDQAGLFLKVMGGLDFLVCFLLIFNKTRKLALGYMFVWGLLTALARILYGVDLNFLSSTLHQNWFEFSYRIPHALLPLVGYLLTKDKKEHQIDT